VHQVAVGPTVAFGAAKQILRHLESGGLHDALEHTTAIASELFDTDDLQRGMASFLADGPGKATFEGR
jgi:enoyl-CoA hydratase/carnithine racemase